jgi:hypothetical protein
LAGEPMRQSLRHDPIQLNRVMVRIACLSMIYSENRYPLFGIMP